MTGRSIHFTRWYDRIPELSRAVALLEKAPRDWQQLIAGDITNAVELYELTGQEAHGFKKLGTEKVMGLMKSKNKRRWYDQDPIVHQAFNYLFLMDDLRRYETAVRILFSLKALEAASKKGIRARHAGSLVRTVFRKAMPVLLEQTVPIDVPPAEILPESPEPAVQPENLVQLPKPTSPEFAQQIISTLDEFEHDMRVVVTREKT